MQEMERSVDQAKRRQLHLLPVEQPPDEIADIAVVYRPLQAVSGDFLDFYSLADNRFGISIGDVSGHGVETAIVMGMAKMAFRVRSQAIGSVKDLMTYANQDLFTELRRSAFITGIFAVIDRDTQEKIDVVKNRMIRNYGYCEICATDVLNFVASIFARGDTKD